MPTPSLESVVERNRTHSSDPYLWLLEIVLPQGTVLRLARNSEGIEWPAGSGQDWTALQFEFDDIDETSKSEVRQITFKVRNRGGVLLRHIEELDAWRKQNGPAACVLTLRLVNAGLLHLAEPDAEVEFEDKGASCPAPCDWAYFRVGAESVFGRACPRRRIIKDYCSWVTTDECPHAPQCDKTLRTCRQTFAYTLNFGGFPEAEGAGAYA